MSVEVFKTNVQEWYHANMLVAEIHKRFTGYKANFDLDDCDKILRVKAVTDMIPPAPIILLLRLYGFHAEVLPDEHHPTDSIKSLTVLKY